MNTQETSEERRERFRREIFERLVSAAEDLLRTRVLDDASVQQIADIADVGKGTFFNYFRSKTHVLPAIIDERIRELESTIERVRRQEQTPRDALYRLLVTRGGRGADMTPKQYGPFYGSFLSALSEDEEMRKLIAERLLHHQMCFESLIALGQKQGAFRSDYSSLQLGRIVYRTNFGAGLLLWIHGLSQATPEDDSFARLLVALLERPACPADRSSRKLPAGGRRARKSKTP